jgi:hypothetical protein
MGNPQSDVKSGLVNPYIIINPSPHPPVYFHSIHLNTHTHSHTYTHTHTTQHSTAQHNTTQHNTTQHNTTQQHNTTHTHPINASAYINAAVYSCQLLPESEKIYSLFEPMLLKLN